MSNFHKANFCILKVLSKDMKASSHVHQKRLKMHARDSSRLSLTATHFDTNCAGPP